MSSLKELNDMCVKNVTKKYSVMSMHSCNVNTSLEIYITNFGRQVYKDLNIYYEELG